MHFLKVILLSGFVVLTACDLYESGLETSSLLQIDECEASGGIDCGNTERNPQELVVEGPNPIIPAASTGDCGDDSGRYCFDISGRCNSGAAPTSSIDIISMVSDFVSNTDIKSQSSILNGPVTCQRGKFHMQLALNNPPCTLHRVTIELVTRDLAGVEQTNPLQARKTVDLQVSNLVDPVSCP